MSVTFRSSLIDSVAGTITLDSLVITTPATKTSYIEGESLDITGLVVTATSGKLTGDVTAHCFIYPQVLSQTGTQTITIDYCGLQTSYQVTVAEVDSIEITHQPYQTSYVLNSSIDLDGIKVIAHAGQDTLDITKLCTYKPADGTKVRSLGNFLLEASYYGKSTSIYYSVVASRTLTVSLDLTNSDPSTWGTYEDDATSMSVGSSAFENFFGCYPCVLEDGKELGRLKTSNFAYYDDNTPAPITTFGKDVMIYFPRRGLKIWHEGDYLKISITDEPNKSGYMYYAFSYKNKKIDGFYAGVYKSYIEDGKAYSISGKIYDRTLDANKSKFVDGRTYSQARGDCYEQCSFFQYTYIQAMFMLKYRGQSQRATIGHGFNGQNGSVSSTHYRGETNTYGMTYYNPNTAFKPTKIFGLENLAGFNTEFMEGAYLSDGVLLLAYSNNYTDNSWYYSSTGNIINGGVASSSFKDVHGGSSGFLASVNQPHSSDSHIWYNTYFCGTCGGGYGTGEFYLGLGYSDTTPSGVQSAIMSDARASKTASIYLCLRLAYNKVKKARSRDGM